MNSLIDEVQPRHMPYSDPYTSQGYGMFCSRFCPYLSPCAHAPFAPPKKLKTCPHLHVLHVLCWGRSSVTLDTAPVEVVGRPVACVARCVACALSSKRCCYFSAGVDKRRFLPDDFIWVDPFSLPTPYSLKPV